MFTKSRYGPQHRCRILCSSIGCILYFTLPWCWTSCLTRMDFLGYRHIVFKLLFILPLNRILGLILIMVEVQWKRPEIEKYFGLLKHYLGRGCYTALLNFHFLNITFNSLGCITINRDRWYFGAVVWVSAIIQWILYGVFC